MISDRELRCSLVLKPPEWKGWEPLPLERMECGANDLAPALSVWQIGSQHHPQPGQGRKALSTGHTDRLLTVLRTNTNLLQRCGEG